MPLSTVDKLKINKYLKETSIHDIYYHSLCEAVGKKTKITEVEFLDYFTETIVADLHKDTKFSTKQMEKNVYLVACFLEWINDMKKEDKDNPKYKISEETLDKIRNFKEFYYEYLTRNNLEQDQRFHDEFLGEVIRIVDEFYPCEKQTESVSKYITKIRELEDEIKKLQLELKESERLYNNLNKEYEKQTSKLETLNKNLTNQDSDIRQKNKNLKELKEQLEILTHKINELEIVLSKCTEEKNSLTNYKEMYENLSQEVEKLKKQLEEEIKIKKANQNLKTKQTKLEALIYQKLLFESATIEDIIKYVKEQGITSDKQEIASLLKNIKSRINIISNSFSLSPSYTIISPSISENGKFTLNIPEGISHYDIMLVSDFHLKSIEKKVLTGFEILNDYCINNNINLILNLGDFYDGIGSKTIEYNNAIKNYKLIEQSISQIPQANGIYHAILGGNHDRNITRYGFDPIKILTDEREDFINLGYTHSTIELKNSKNIIGIFDVHHPDTFEFSIKLDEFGMDTECLEKYLKELYQQQNRNRNNSYIDIFGHTHKSQFNYPSSYCYIPSFFEGQQKKGACHLRIYFDTDKAIKYMVFMPLSVNGTLSKNNEIIYKKTLTK